MGNGAAYGHDTPTPAKLLWLIKATRNSVVGILYICNMSTTTLKHTLMRNPRIGGEVIVVLGYNSTAGKKVVRALRSCCNESTYRQPGQY